MRPDDLGGRLPLLAPDALTEEQRQLHDAMEKTIVPEAERGGFVARLDDGRFIGPFNALLRAPALAAGFGQWTARIGQAGLPEDVRQVVILAVGTAWAAEYELYAHVAAARAENVPQTAIDAILGGTEPIDAGDEARVAYRLAVAVVQERSVPQGTYEEAIAAFAPDGVMTLLSLIAQYQFVSSVLTCFEVPSPSRDDDGRKSM